MEESKQNNNGMGPARNASQNDAGGPWWKPGVEIFSEVSTWIVVPIVLALVFGKMLDAHYGTRPMIFLSLSGLAFLFSCFKIVRVIKNYMKKLQKQDKDIKNY